MLAALLTVFAVAPLTYPGFFQAHSGFMPAFNVTFPALGRGAADVVRGDGPLPTLVAWVFWKLAGSGVAGVRWGYGLAIVLGALGTFGWLRGRVGSRGALLAATLYTYLPWHLATVYVRGAYAEAWLWALWPFALWAVGSRAGPRRVAAAAVAVLLLAATLGTQPGLAAAFLLYLIVVILQPRRLSRWTVIALAAILVAVISIGILSPPSRVPLADHFLYPYQLFSPAWGYGVSVPGWQDGLPFQIGVAAFGLALLAVMLAARAEKRREFAGAPSGVRPAVWGSAAALAVILLLTLAPAAPIWRATGLDELMTYPWQILALAGLPLACLAGSVVRLEPRLGALPALGALAALVVLAAMPGLAPRFTRLDPGAQPVAALQPAGAPSPQILLLADEVLPPTDITPTLTLTLTWQATAPVAGDYTVFVHLLAPDATKVAQQDTRPCDGNCPTDTWQPGQIVIDRHTLSIPPNAPPGPYRLAIGLYLLATNERAAVMGRDDQTVYIDVP